VKKFFYDLSLRWLRKLIWGIEDRRVLLRTTTASISIQMAPIDRF